MGLLRKGVMRNTKHIRNERGIALMLTIFGLLLLTAVAVAMMYSSDSETTIAVNYRDKEAASYAAMAGLQEARDRIQPRTGDLSGWTTAPGPSPSLPVGPGPTQLPTNTNAQILYIINPGTSETAAGIAPWSPTVNGNPNPYFDKELCQENLAGQPGSGFTLATGNVGTPCAAAAGAAACKQFGAAGNGWCTYYDESANATNWRLKDPSGNRNPLDYKWVRVMMKADNSSPVYLTGANGTQVCWDGISHQVQRPAGSGNNCQGALSGSAIASLSLSAGGTGYSSVTHPLVTFTGGGGSGATATAQTSTTPGGIVSDLLTNSGSGYTSQPTVTISLPDGSGATLQALVTGSPVTAVTVGTANYCYATGTSTAAATVNFTPSNPGTGSTAAATPVFGGQSCVSAFTASGTCSNQKGNVGVPVNIAGGFTGTVDFASSNGKVQNPVVTNVGSYASVPATQNFSVNGGCTISLTFSGGFKISSVNLTAGGQYLSQPTATVSGISSPKAPTAAQPTLNAAWIAGANNGKLSGVQVTNAGSNYALPSYNLVFTGGGGGGATGTAHSSAVTKISGLTLTNGGSNYTAPPTVVITDPLGLGSGASATASLVGGVPLNYGVVYTMTSMAITKNGQGAQAMAQMEAATVPPWQFKLGGALTLAGPSPSFSTPNSNNYQINGNDANSCGQTADPSLPAIGVYDDPNNPTNPTAQSSVISDLGKPQNYIGAQSAPDVVNTFNTINATPDDLNALVNDYATQSNTVTLTAPASSLPATTMNSITYVPGDLSLSGNPTGNGILIVTGTLTLSGNFTWNGLILVIGQGTVVHNGGGNGNVIGAMYIAKTKDASGNLLSTMGSPNWTWNGGGTNSLLYDHCNADNLLNKYGPVPSTAPLKILSTRVLEF